ncbi:MAG TPA: hypothetical protein VF783_18250 [Terriglobales bacterium]
MVKQKLTDWQIEDAKRLHQLWNERRPKGMTQEKFGVEYDMGTQGNVNLYLKGKSRLNVYAVGQFAKVLNVKIDQISPNLADQVRDLYRNCDADRNRDYGVTPEMKELIRLAVKEEAQRQQGADNGPTSDNGKNF